ALLGNALMQTGRFEQAEQALLVAVAQSSRNLTAHELLARLYRDHLDRPQSAFPHEGMASALRTELANREKGVLSRRKREENKSEGDLPPSPQKESRSQTPAEFPAPFAADINGGRIITVVSGLPRSGTSMMMQLLAAAGRPVLSDANRAADE